MFGVYYQVQPTFDFSDLKSAETNKIEYYFEVWDNDGINGSKSTRSNISDPGETTSFICEDSFISLHPIKKRSAAIITVICFIRQYFYFIKPNLKMCV